MKERSRQVKVLVAAAAAGLAAAAATVGGSPVAAHGDGVPCYGINKCKGTGDCGGKGHACHGQNACQGQGFLSLERKEDCLRIRDGRLTADLPIEQPTTR